MDGGVTVRPLETRDLEPARWVVFRAYFEVLLDLYGPAAATQYELRSLAFMAMYRRRAPRGCFVAETGDGTLAGVVFCFTWGQAGWFGSLAVAPEWQRRGVGAALVAQAVEYLQGAGCVRLGLETWPQSAAVQRLYGRFGFAACRETVKLSRAGGAAPPPPGWTAQWAGAGAPVNLARTLELVGVVQARLRAAAPDEPPTDYRAEIAVPVEAGWAEALLVAPAGAEPAAFALCYLKKPSGQPVAALDTRLLAVAPGEREAAALDAILAALDRRALALGVESVTCDVNLRHSAAVGLLRARGFHPVYELLRMERPVAGFDAKARSPLIDCARWAG